MIVILSQNQSVNTPRRKSILFYLFLLFFQGSRQSECEEKTMKQPKIVVSLKVMNFCQTTTQGDRTCVEKTFSKYICPCTKILVFCRLKHQVTWLKFLSETASCVSHGPMKALRSIHDFFLNFVTLSWRGFYTPYVSTTLLLITAGSLHRQQWQTACYSDESFPVYIGVVCV